MHNISSDTSSLTRPETCKKPVRSRKRKMTKRCLQPACQKGVITEVVGGSARSLTDAVMCSEARRRKQILPRLNGLKREGEQRRSNSPLTPGCAEDASYCHPPSSWPHYFIYPQRVKIERIASPPSAPFPGHGARRECTALRGFSGGEAPATGEERCRQSIWLTNLPCRGVVN